MATLFDTLAELTLGLRRTATPVTPSLFAPDPAAAEQDGVAFGDIKEEVDAPEPARRRALPRAEGSPESGDATPEPRSRGASTAAEGGERVEAPGMPAQRPRLAGEPARRRRSLPARLVPDRAPAPIAANVRAASAPAAQVSEDGGGGTQGALEAIEADPTPPARAEAFEPRPDPQQRRRPRPQPVAAPRLAQRDRDGAHESRPSQEAVVHVTIGRIDVRAVAPREPAPRPSAPRPNPGPALSDYLRDRGGRGTGGAR